MIGLWISLLIFNIVESTDDLWDKAEIMIDPRMNSAKINDKYKTQRENAWIATEPHNIHTLFRKKFVLEYSCEKATLWITADDCLKLYINGKYVLEGPTTGYPFAYPYYQMDVTSYLTEGLNVIAIHAYYRGLINRVGVSGDNRSGVLLRLVVKDVTGRMTEVHSDATWKCLPLEAFITTDTIGYKTQFLENIDMTKYPHGWTENHFDDSQWMNPITRSNDYTFFDYAVKPIQVHPLFPIRSYTTESGTRVFDFGRETVGYTRLKLQGEHGQKIVVYHGEELDETQRVRWEMRANCNYKEEVILSGREEIVPFYDYKAFRYIELENAPENTTVWVEERHYPFDTRRCYFSSEDVELTKIWNICATGVRLCAQEGFLDCPSREKGQYLGDAVITSRSFMWLTGDTSLSKKSIWDFYFSSQIDPGLTAVAPSGFIQEFVDYSLQFPLLLWEYYRHSGDVQLLAKIGKEFLPNLLEYYAQFENEDGLILCTDFDAVKKVFKVGPKPILIDWPRNLRDDFDLTLNQPISVINAFYYGAMKKTLDIFNTLGLNNEGLMNRMQKFYSNYQKYFLDPERRLYKDNPNSDHYSLHASALSLFFGLVPDESTKQSIFRLIQQKGLFCGVYIASYVMEACMMEGNAPLGWQLLMNDTEYSWKEMLRNGATACLEVWKPEMKTNMSWCHAWSSCPIYIVSEYILGVKPGKPGWESIIFDPAPLTELPYMYWIKPIPQGYCSLRVQQNRYVLTVPPVVKVVSHPKNNQQLIVKQSISHQKPPLLSHREHEILSTYQWQKNTQGERAIWVSVNRQTLYLIENDEVVWFAPCSTASNGVGELANSNKTPRGWHVIADKIGENAPWGQIYRGRKPSGIWYESTIIDEDLVLTRILHLQGLEEGKNKGKNAQGECVDSYDRNIYIHGTNAEDMIGKPASRGCIRLSNDDIIYLFNQVSIGTKVLITEE